MGGIYILGIQPGTMIHGNIIHDISGENISWGIYLDEGSSEIIIENNLVYNIASECFHVHYGRNNMVRNNVFACGEDGTCSITRGTMDMEGKFSPGDKVFFCENNIMISSAAPFYVKYLLDYEIKEDIFCFAADNNIFHNIKTEEPVIGGDDYHNRNHTYGKIFTLEEWKEKGFDRNSQFAGPNETVIPQALFPQDKFPQTEKLYHKLLTMLQLSEVQP